MKKLLLLCAFTAGMLNLAAQPKIIAHRGFYTTEGSWENTVSSLANAQKLGTHAAELDVNMTADDQLVVCHGPKINGTDLHAQKNKFAEIRAARLPNGDQVPTLREIFEQGKKGPATKMIIEIKTHPTPKRETQVVEAVLKLAREMDVIPLVEITSFSKHMCSEVVRLQPGMPVIYLSSSLKAMGPAEAKQLGYTGISYPLNVMMNRPELISEANKLGIETTIWQANDHEVVDWAIRHGVTYVSSDYSNKVKAYLDAVAQFKTKP
ncbi:glycerophosphodiester phosphodiesterase [Ereboglobus luteus]|uniref:Glycerophosphodiester phosphodiesterase n=1 Tax=Ereboglobus luteus TaxID=1796921 RepID=A0A2U8E1N3_9BACT|nr:glycerophosphodiester phosphodiesterase family protein [Ereboglobus luteus]AWI08788.1 glycerophosphodiester phosphodiesterase [Ereboglobus luteus]